MKYTLTHQKTKLSQVLREDSRHGIPNTYSTQMICDGRHTPEPVDEMTLSAHKWSSISDTHQNQLERCPNSTLCSQSSLNLRHTCQKQLAKCPDSTLCSKEKCAWGHTVDLLCLRAVSMPRCVFPFQKGRALVDSQ